MHQQLDQAIDDHVIAQIEAANPPSGSSGVDLIAQVRHAVGAMRAVGSMPTVLALSPDDAAALDLTQTGADDAYLFTVKASGSASPLWNLRVVESPQIIDPLLLDQVLLGLIYTGVTSVEADPYSGFDQNVTRLRAESYVLMHVRSADGAYVIEAGS